MAEHPLPAAAGVEPPTAGPEGSPVPLASILCTEELTRRPARTPDYETESRALTTLMQALADSPGTILHTLANTVMTVVGADSAGLSLLTKDENSFYWVAIAGAWHPHLGGGTPREFGPCGDVLDCNAPLLFRHWERRYPYLLAAAPLAEEGLLVPFHVGGKAVGTIWAIAHDDRRQFDAEDLRQLESLARFAAAAYLAATSLETMDEQQERLRTSQGELVAQDHSRRAALNLMEDAIDSRHAVEMLHVESRERAEYLARELAATRELQAVSATLIEGGDTSALYQRIVDAALAIMGSDGASMQVIDAGHDALRMLAWRGFGPAFGEIFALNGPDTQTSCSVAMRTGHRVVVPDVAACGFIVDPVAVEAHRQMRIQAVQSTPLFSRSGGGLLGMISTHWQTPHTPAEDELRRLDILARQAADLLERNQAEAALRDERARLEAVLLQLPEGVIIAEAPSGRPVLVNAQLASIWRHELTVAEGIDQVAACKGFHGDGRPYRPDQWPLARTVATGEVVLQEEIGVERGDGSSGWMAVSAAPVHDAGGTIIAGVATFTDVTDRKRAGEERDRLLVSERSARQRAEEADRLKDEFLATLSHELRTPLNAMLGWLQMMRAGTLDDVKAARALAAVERNAQAQRQLVGDMLDVSGMMSGKLRFEPRPTDLTPVIEAAVETVRPGAAAKGVQLRIALDPTVGPVSGDAGRLQQVIWNLLTNAVKYTPTGGHIDTRLECRGTQAAVIVRDTGEGISADFLPHVFSRFRQADGATTRQHGGLGLGLAIVRYLVEAHGGQVSASSDGAGRGAAFTVTLPLCSGPGREEANHADSPVRPIPSRHTLHALRVLVVDDDTDSRELLRVALTQNGARVKDVATVRAALDAVNRWHPDLLVSDIGMPERDGYELMRQVRALPSGRGAQLLAVALTGYASPEVERKALAAGYGLYVPKPVDLDELMAALARLVAKDVSSPGRRKPRAAQEAKKTQEAKKG